MRLRYCVQLFRNVQGHLQLQSSVQLFDIAFRTKKSTFCGVYFKCISTWKQDTQEGSSQNEIFPLLVVFHLPYSKYKGVKICFHSYHCQNQNFSLVSHSCRFCGTHVALESLVQHSCCICIALVSLVSGTRVVNQTRSFLNMKTLEHVASWKLLR